MFGQYTCSNCGHKMFVKHERCPQCHVYFYRVVDEAEERAKKKTAKTTKEKQKIETDRVELEKFFKNEIEHRRLLKNFIEKNGGAQQSVGKFGIFTDKRDGKKYLSVKIGSQTWMAENLAFKCEGCHAYHSDEFFVSMLGYYYDFKTACAIAPSGWHLPSKDEWLNLIEFVGSDLGKISAVLPGATEGITNSSGLSVLPGGRGNDGFGLAGREGYVFYWTSAPTGQNIASYCSFNTVYSSRINVSEPSWSGGLYCNVRCIKNN